MGHDEIIVKAAPAILMLVGGICAIFAGIIRLLRDHVGRMYPEDSEAQTSVRQGTDIAYRILWPIAKYSFPIGSLWFIARLVLE